MILLQDILHSDVLQVLCCAAGAVLCCAVRVMMMLLTPHNTACCGCRNPSRCRTVLDHGGSPYPRHARVERAGCLVPFRAGPMCRTRHGTALHAGGFSAILGHVLVE